MIGYWSISEAPVKNPHKRKPAWVRELIQGAERYGALEENHRERKRTRSNSGYVALLCDFIDKEPSSYEEEAKQKEWKDAMIEEYQSIMKNDVWDVVPRPEGKSVVVTSPSLRPARRTRRTSNNDRANRP